MLQDQVDPRPFAEVELAVQRELGAPIAQLFADFEPAARAAASLAQVPRRPLSLLSSMVIFINRRDERWCFARKDDPVLRIQCPFLPLQWHLNPHRHTGFCLAQVHKARLADGREVAVKIQYAGLPTAVAADITTLSALASLALRWFPNAFDFGCAAARSAPANPEVGMRTEQGAACLRHPCNARGLGVLHGSPRRERPALMCPGGCWRSCSATCPPSWTSGWKRATRSASRPPWRSAGASLSRAPCPRWAPGHHWACPLVPLSLLS